MAKIASPRVSVVIPTFNNAAYVLEAIESVFEQTYTDREIIVVDDGSTDGTRALLEPYADRLQYLAQDNRGAGGARNRGVQVARGELIAFLDADDLFLLPDKLERQVACFDCEPSLGVNQTGWRLIEQDGETLSEVRPWRMMPDLSLSSRVKWHVVLPSTMMIRRTWLERLGGFDASLSPAEDLDLVLRLALHRCPASWLPAITVGYRQHGANATRNTFVQARAHEAALDKFFATPALPAEISRLEHDVRYYHLVWMAWRHFHMGHRGAMARYLRKSLPYAPFHRQADATANWIEIFARESAALNRSLEPKDLQTIEQWRQFVPDEDI